MLAVFGIGGLGAYAVQYAKLLGAGATVVAFARHPDKLAVARAYGADHVISAQDKSTDDIRQELRQATGQGELNAVIDCAGAEEMIRMGFALLSIAGHYASVGLVGDRINIPLFPMVAREYTYHGSFWGNYNGLDHGVGHPGSLGARDKYHSFRRQLRAHDVIFNLYPIYICKSTIIYSLEDFPSKMASFPDTNTAAPLDTASYTF